MKTLAADLSQQSRVADAAARCLRAMSFGQPGSQELLAVAAALEQSVFKLRQLEFGIQNSREAA